MRIIYVCRKCKKFYSKTEYTQSKFCTVCGSFLLTTFQQETSETQTAQKEPQHEQEPVYKEKMALFRAAESLLKRVRQTKEYEVVSEKENKPQKPHAFENWLWHSEYEETLQFEKQLLKQYKGKTLEEALPGKIVSNEQGQCYEISTSCCAKFKKATYEESKQILISDLKVLPGIGPVSEQILKKQGYTTVEDLTHHPRWRNHAYNYMKLINTKETCAAQKWLWQRLPKSHPLLHYLAGFCQDNNFAIVDIETLGLSERPIILLGIAKPTKDHICTSQFLLRDIPDEPSAIYALISQLDPNLSLITYNGKSFDIPYIKQRLAYYGINEHIDNINFDILHFTRRALKPKLTDCKLETVEKYLGIKRDINIPGALVPHFYDTYLRTKNVGPLVPIVEHNRQDLLTLSTLFSKLYEEWTI
ncbi:MAG: ribonuclease H-like domain-containing protein [Candidatus Bathyarchaeota archaeon]|nr:ribonuclease H-like domain-containing protein [Candidatus Termiticorpusculum sp.]